MKANPRHSGILLAGIQKTAWMPVFTGMTTLIALFAIATQPPGAGGGLVKLAIMFIIDRWGVFNHLRPLGTPPGNSPDFAPAHSPAHAGEDMK